MEKQVQQGDINIIAYSIPSNAKTRKSSVIREGETTGHAHRIIGSSFAMYEVANRIFARIFSNDCQIVHEEHHAIDLPVGDYEFLPTHEYDHFAEESSYLRD